MDDIKELSGLSAEEQTRILNDWWAAQNPDKPRISKPYLQPDPFFAPAEPDVVVHSAARPRPATPAETRRFLLLVGIIMAGLLFGLGLALWYAPTIDGVRL